MSWGISPNATEKEKIFADFNDSLNGMNSADGLSYHHYSKIYDIGRELADKEYQQGIIDERERIVEWCKDQSRILKKQSEDFNDEECFGGYRAFEDMIRHLEQIEGEQNE